MKKFFSLVLALVMALSLTTAAWGTEEVVTLSGSGTAADPYVAATADELVEALENSTAGEIIRLTDNITIDPAKMSNAYGKTGIVVENGQILDGAGKTLTVKSANNTWDSGVCLVNGTMKNLTVAEAFRGIFIRSNTQKVILENVTTQGTVYTISLDQGGGGGLEATNCTFNGWTSFAATLGNAVFTNCTFGEGSGYAFCRPYAPTTFVGCSFAAEDYMVDPVGVVTFENCTFNGAALTNDNLATLVISDKGSLDNATVLSNATPEAEVAAPEVKVDAAVTGADNQAAANVIAATGGITFDTAADTALTAAAATIAASTEKTEADAVEALKNEGYSVNGASVVVETSFEVEVKAVDIDNATLTLDITPVYEVIATNGTDSVVLESDEVKDFNEAVTITVKIPKALATQANGILYVVHDETHEYVATVSGNDADGYTATFVAENGFSPFVFSLSPSVASVDGTLYPTLQAAITAATSATDKTVTLLKNVELTEQLTLPEGVTLDGANYTVSVAGDTWSTVNGYKNLVLLSKDTTLKNVTLDSEGKAYGVQAYCVTGVKLDNVTLKNSKGAGLTVNGSDVTAVNLKASGNAWGSVNVDPGSGVTTESSFAVSGANTNLADATSIWSDGNNVTTGTNEVEVSIDGGTYAGTIDVPAAAGSAVVSAGTFTDDVTSYLAPGSVYKDGVVVKQTSTPTTGTTSTGTVTSGTVTPVKPALYRLATVGGSMTKLPTVITEIKLTTVSGKIDADVVKYVPNIYSINGDLYIQVAKSAATYALYNNGSYIYLYDVPQTTDTAAIAAYATSVVMDKLVVPADEDIDCGDCLKGGKLASYYVSGDNVYYAGGYTWAYFNGEFVKYDKDTKVVFQGHTWDAKSIKVKATDVKGVKVPVSIECEKCEKTFDIVGKAKFDNTWVKGVNYTTTPAVDAYGSYYIVLPGVTYGNTYVPSTDKVTSADTFDAGIAMYVGMSVLAATGSAVVLKKKH